MPARAPRTDYFVARRFGRNHRDASTSTAPARSIASLKALGAHGLPLMGGGDWNDGMNRVGAERPGRVASGSRWFLCATLVDGFGPIARGARRPRRARKRWGSHADRKWREATANARDGTAQWYKPRLSSTTARRSAPARQCRMPHRFSWRKVVGTHLARRGSRGVRSACAMDSRSTSTWSTARGRTSILLLRRRRSTVSAPRPPVTSRAICPGCARTAGNIRTPQCLVHSSPRRLQRRWRACGRPLLRNA